MRAQPFIHGSLAALLVAACAPDEVSVVDDHVFASAHFEGTPDGVRVEVGAHFSDLDGRREHPPLGCERFAADTWISVGGQRLDIVSLGGVAESGYCAGVSAVRVLPLELLVGSTTVELGDGAGTRAAPLWTSFEPRTARVVPPLDGLLHVDVPFALAWSPDSYGFTFDVGLADVPGIRAEVLSVNGREISARLVGRLPSPDPFEPDTTPAVLGVSAKAEHRQAGFLNWWTERWSFALPVTVELEPPPPARHR